MDRLPPESHDELLAQFARLKGQLRPAAITMPAVLRSTQVCVATRPVVWLQPCLTRRSNPSCPCTPHRHAAVSARRRAARRDVPRRRLAAYAGATGGAGRVNALEVPALSRVASCELRRERIDLTAIARGGGRATSRRPGRVMDVEIADGLTAIGDPQLVTIALGHLLGNAWRFTGKRARAEIRLEREREGIFVVRGNGAGSTWPKRGGCSSRSSGCTRATFDGAGIGLAVVRRIAERHGGDAWAYGVVDGGATIWFSLGPGSDPDRP